MRPWIFNSGKADSDVEKHSLKVSPWDQAPFHEFSKRFCRTVSLLAVLSKRRGLLEKPRKIDGKSQNFNLLSSKASSNPVSKSHSTPRDVVLSRITPCNTLVRHGQTMRSTTDPQPTSLALLLCRLAGLSPSRAGETPHLYHLQSTRTSS